MVFFAARATLAVLNPRAPPAPRGR